MDMDSRRAASLGLVAFLALAAPVVPAHATEGAALKVARITPLGLDVPPGRQIVIEFNRPVVPLGRMARQASELPITIAPALKCHWRWIDRQALACNLDEQDRMVPATRYKIMLAPGIRTMDGATTQGAREWEFTTLRPDVSRVHIQTWRHPGVPVLRAVFNQPVTRASVENSVRLVVGNAEARVRAAADPDDRAPALYVGDPAETSGTDGSAEGPAGKPRESDGDGASESGREARRLWLVEPARELPLDADVDLNVERGLVSAHGPERGVSRRSVVRFRTFGEFRFLGVRCFHHREDAHILITPGQADKSMCNPLAGVSLSFSSPVLSSEIKREVVFRPDLAGGRDDYDPWSRRADRSQLRYTTHRKDRTYDVLLPERLQAFQRYDVRSRRSVGDVLRSWFQGAPETRILDEFGRPLAQAIRLSFRTSHRNPDFKLIHRDAVLESALDSEVPLYVTNLEEVRLDYRLVGERGARTGLSHTLRPADIQDVSFAVRLGVREMTLGATGAVFGRLTSTPPARWKFDHRFFAQVTPYQVHAKIGHFNTLVWVTDLATGEPVSDASVTVYRDVLMRMGAPPTDATDARTDGLGIAMLPGTRTLDPELETFGWRCRERDRDACARLFVRVDGEKGMALLPLSSDYRIHVGRVSGYQFWPSQETEYGHIHAWGTTAQGVYRAGDTIQYKVYVRDQDNERFVPAPASGYTLTIVDPTGKTVHEVEDLTLNEFGALQGAYAVPENGVMGWHRFVLKSSFAGNREWRPMRVLVTDFTPAAFRVRSGLNGDLFHPGDTVAVRTAASLHSGGPYTQAEARVTAELRRRWFSSKHPVAKNFRFDTGMSREGMRTMRIHQEVGDLADDGTHVAHVDLAPGDIVYGRLRVESAIRDDRGKYVAASASADYLGIDRLVGLRKDKWVFDEDEEAEVLFIVVNAHGEPVDDTQVAIEIEHRVTKAARVMGAGNAYTTRFTEEWVPVAACSGAPVKAPLPCRFTPANPGRYRVKAGIEDTHGRRHETELLAWVAGKGRVVWREERGHAMELVPEQDQYRVGDNARFLVKNPFPGATALVTLERYGIIKQWHTRLRGSTPILEFPIEPELVPGAYLSVVVFSPRVESPPAQEQESAGQEIDLGKPAFRIGYAELAVVDPYKQLEVAVATDRDVYKPRDTVAVSLAAQPRNAAGTGNEPIEYAVAVLDEAVFDLIAAGRSHFDPYEGFYSVDGLDVENYSLLTRLVGRQKIDKKGASSGGDGGAGLDLRTLFKYVGYWNPSLRADAGGKARFEFALPDNLTGWRVLALAVTPGDRFGLGDVSFKTNQPTQIRPVMPNQVTEGDQFVAGFAVMNRTDARRTLAVTITAGGDVDGDAARVSRQIALDPYQRETVYLSVAAARLKKSRDAPSGIVRFEARAGDSTDSDAVVHEIPVRKRRDLEVAAEYGSIANAGISQPVVFPADIQPDVGEVAVVLSPTVVGNVEGAFRYMRDYPYSCWEQVLSQGVMASHFGALQGYLDPSLEWPNSGELPAATLARAASYQAPNGGMAYWIPEDRNVSPYLSAYTALAFNWLRDAGHKVPAPVENRLHEYLLHLLRSDVVPGFYSRGMSSTVRAVAINALAARGKADRRDLRRYAPHVRTMDLFGAANFLQAVLRLGGAEDLAKVAMDRLMASRSASGGKLAFDEEVDHGYERILTTPLRSNCAILSALSEVEDLEKHGLDADTAMAMTRAISQTRGNRDHWENTQENLFCLNALIDYANRWESVPPAIRASVDFDGVPMGEGAFDDFRDRALRFSTPVKPMHAGRDTEIEIRREGAGRLYYAASIAYAPDDGSAERVNAGIDVRREYAVQRGGEWILLTEPATVSRGELVRVDLFLELSTARNFVVVDDHVPGALEPVDRDLATASGVDAAEGDFEAAGGSRWFQFGDWRGFGTSRWSFYHREMSHHAVRFYSDYLPPGRYHLSYTAQAIAAGTFAVRPAHAGEMYDIDVFGKTSPLRLVVGEPR